MRFERLHYYLNVQHVYALSGYIALRFIEISQDPPSYLPHSAHLRPDNLVTLPDTGDLIVNQIGPIVLTDVISRVENESPVIAAISLTLRVGAGTGPRYTAVTSGPGLAAANEPDSCSKSVEVFHKQKFEKNNYSPFLPMNLAIVAALAFKATTPTVSSLMLPSPPATCGNMTLSCGK